MKNLAFVFAAVLSVCATAPAQEGASSQREFYRLDFVLKDMEGGKLISSRSFQTMAPTEATTTSSVRSGERIPVSMQGKTDYLDVGVNLDVKRLHRAGEEMTLDIIAEASTADATTRVVRQAKWDGTVIIPLRKATVIFSSDGPTPKRQLQLEVTATPMH